MIRAGAILLTLWAGFHLVAGLGILALVLGLGRNAPALLILFGDLRGGGIEPRALATINYLAALCNAWRVALCAVALAVIWKALVRGAAWAVWALAGALVVLQAASLASDFLLPHRNLPAEAVFLAVPLVGIALAALGVRRGQRPPREATHA